MRLLLLHDLEIVRPLAGLRRRRRSALGLFDGGQNSKRGSLLRNRWRLTSGLPLDLLRDLFGHRFRPDHAPAVVASQCKYRVPLDVAGKGGPIEGERAVDSLRIDLQIRNGYGHIEPNLQDQLRFSPIPFGHDHAIHPRVQVDEQAPLGEEVTGHLDLGRKSLLFSHPSPLADSRGFCQAGPRIRQAPLSTSGEREHRGAENHQTHGDSLACSESFVEEQAAKEDAAERTEGSLQGLEHGNPE